MKLHQHSLRSYCLCFFSVLLSIVYLTVTTMADLQESNSLWNDTNLQVVGTLQYMGSNTDYRPVQELNGVHAIEFSNSAENQFIKEPYLTSTGQTTIQGVLDVGFNVSYGFGTYLCVTQPHYSYNNSQRDAIAYYRVSVERIDTQMLYRPERAENVSAVIVGGVVLIAIYTVIRWVRR